MLQWQFSEIYISFHANWPKRHISELIIFTIQFFCYTVYGDERDQKVFQEEEEEKDDNLPKMTTNEHPIAIPFVFVVVLFRSILNLAHTFFRLPHTTWITVNGNVINKIWRNIDEK